MSSQPHNRKPRKLWLAAASTLVIAAVGWSVLSAQFEYGRGHAERPILDFFALYALAWAAYLAGFFLLKRRSGKGPVAIILVAGFAARLVLLPSNLIQENDVYRYVLDGNVILHGGNPYQHSPLVLPELAEPQLKRELKQPDAQQGGWSITGITTLQSGSPFTTTTGIDNNRDGTFNDRVGPIETGDPKSALADNSNVVKNPSINNGAPTFLLPNGNGVIGDPVDPINIAARLGRGFFHGPGLAGFDFGVRKVTPLNYKMLGENANLEFRGEFFNIFNHTNFSAPNINFRSPFFGQILASRTFPRDIQFGLKLNF